MHDHHHGAPTSEGQQRRLALALALAASYMLAELAGGLWTGSLALLADAGHMLSDVFALSLSVFAFRLARRPATPQQTYGHHRTEILAALVNGLLLVGVAVYILSEAVERIETPREILGGPMLAIAAGGLLVNLSALWILREGRHHNLNVRGAWLHVMSDAFGSSAAIAAGGLIWAFGWYWADPLASLVIAILIVYSAWTLLREVVEVLMEWAPSHIDVSEVERSIAALPGVMAVHDLHIWTISSGRISLSGHVVSEAEHDCAKLLQEVTDLLHERFEISHATIQIETPDFDEPGGVCFP
jgi:cobalt-zinc-cadmium efflux system protein